MDFEILPSRSEVEVAASSIPYWEPELNFARGFVSILFLGNLVL